MSELAPVQQASQAPSEKLSQTEHVDAVEAAVEDSDHITLQGWLGIFSIWFTYNSYLFTLQMPGTVLAYINADLGPDPNYIWITVSWNLVAAIVVTISGRLADIFGRRYFMVAGALISTVGAIVGATGHSIGAMIASGVLFGLGGGIQEMAFSCLQELVPNNRRFLALGIYECGNMPSSFSALISYGFIAHVRTGWRTCYYWCIAWEGACSVLLFCFYHPPSFRTKHRADHETVLHLLGELDYVGLVAFAGAAALLLMAISWGGVLHPWRSAVVLAPICVSVCLFIFVGFWETYAPLRYPILPPRLFRKVREFTTILLVSLVAGMLYYSNIALWPRVSAILFLRADDTLMRGLYANITALSTTVAAIYLIAVTPRVHRERWQLVGLQVLQTAMVGSMASINEHAKARAIVFTLLGVGAATATSVITVGTIGLFLDDQADIGVAVGLASTARLIGGAIAGAIYTSIYTNKYKSDIPGQLHKFADAAGFNGSFAALLQASSTNTDAAYTTVPGITDAVVAAAKKAVVQTYIPAFHLVYYVAIAFGILSIACALATRSVPLSKKTKTRAVTLENERGVHGVAERAPEAERGGESSTSS